MKLRSIFLALLFVTASAGATDYGRTTQGASFLEVENDVSSREITVPGGETSVSVVAYLQTTNGSTADCKAVFYNAADQTLAYQTGQITFADDTGGWKTFTFSTAVAAGTYRLSIGCGGIAGGASTVNVAYDVVTASSTLRRASSATGGSQSTYPTFPATITWDGGTGTGDISIYFQTSASSSSGLLRRRRG